MAKKQTPKKQPNKVHKAVSGFWQKNWFALLLVVVLLGVLAFIGVNKLIIYNQKKQFDQAEKSLDTLYADIVKNVGQPADMKKDKSCDYRSAALENGERICGISIYYEIKGVMSKDVAQSNIQKIENTLKSNGVDMEETNISLHEDYINKEVYVAENHYIDQVSKLTCYISYSFNAPSKTNILSIDSSCFGPARTEIYPVKN